MEAKKLNIKLKIWRQKNSNTAGSFVDYDVQVSPDASFLEMLDELNNTLELKGEEAHQFEFEPYKSEDYTEIFNNEVTVSCLIFREENSALEINASAGEENPNIQIVIQIDPRFEPQVYKTLYMKLADDIRHELEHIEQYEKRPDIFTSVKTRAAINRDPKKMMRYFLYLKVVKLQILLLQYAKPK
jgi:succinate dehydrogenase/fumarate reductase-like Fe-S protein